jgi:hypothetical protein
MKKKSFFIICKNCSCLMLFNVANENINYQNEFSRYKVDILKINVNYLLPSREDAKHIVTIDIGF